MSSMESIQPQQPDKHPKGLYVLFAAEAWERFSFYSMLALFTLYLRDPAEGFGWTEAEAIRLYSWVPHVRLRKPAGRRIPSGTGISDTSGPP